jgi:choline monooxygenase
MADNLDILITPVQQASVRAPIAEALTLPHQAFTSEAFFGLEIERLFYRQWTALCFIQQIPAQGCLYPMAFAGIPLLVVHGDDGVLRVFHNIVAYDGCLAVIEPSQEQTEIVTPYHGWRYDLRGKLVATPFWDGSVQGDLTLFEGRSVDLLEVRSHVELGIVFIDLSGVADGFDGHIAPLHKLLSEYRTDNLDIGRDAGGAPVLDGEDLATNWKTHYENWAINVLHEGFSHEIYAESSQIPRVDEKGEKTYVEVIDGALMALSYREQDFSETYQLDELPFTPLGVNSDILPERAFIGSLFPNLHMAVFPYFIHFIIVHPVSAGQTRTLRAQFYEATSATDPDLLEVRLEHQHEFQQAGWEDGRIIEAIQKARQSPVYRQQFYSPFWDNMRYTFSNSVLTALQKNANGH